MSKFGKKFGFHEQLGIGDRGEMDFCKHYAELEPAKSINDLKYDFTLKDGKTVEIKTDSYSCKKTPNFFLETESNNKNGKQGGVLRAKTDNVNLFIYYFINDKTYYWFDVNELYDKFLEYITVNKPNLKTIPNRGYITSGYACKRDFFDGICIRKDVF